MHVARILGKPTTADILLNYHRQLLCSMLQHNGRYNNSGTQMTDGYF